MRLSLSQAAHVISELSGHFIDRKGLRFQWVQENVHAYLDAGRLVMDKEEVLRFAKFWKGGKRGPKYKFKKEH